MMLAFVGTYTRSTDAEGIYGFAVSVDCHDWQPSAINEGIDNPSWLARHPGLPVIYAVNETADDGGAGHISAFSYTETGKLSRISGCSSLGANPCHLAVSDSGKWLIVSNYTGGSFATYGINADGTIGEMASLVQHNGKGVDPMRQKGPHVHSAALAAFGPGEAMVYIADLGIDRVMGYPISSSGLVDSAKPESLRLKPGAGPRLLCFDSQESYGYLINELDNTIVSFERDRHGHLTELETVSTLPAGFTGASYCAHLQLSADDRFLYASNRGHDSIVVFATSADGRLSALQWQPTGGCHPRHFALSPDGTKLVTANRDSNNITVFDRHPETGLLAQTGVELSVPAPVCIRFC